MAALLSGLAVVVVLVYMFVFSDQPIVEADVIDFSQSAQAIEELSTMKSHMRFSVVVHEQSGNIIVRRLADQAEQIDATGIGAALFQDPTMIVELHGVATYGIRLGDIEHRITQTDSTVRVVLPPVEVLDVKLVASDTKPIARMEGLFRSSSQSLLLAATQRGEGFVRNYAETDTMMMGLAAERARNVLSLLVERAGKRAVFE